MEVRQLSGALGAEIHGIDLSQDLSGATIQQIRTAWLEHLVIFFRNQDMPPARLMIGATKSGLEPPFVDGPRDA